MEEKTETREPDVQEKAETAGSLTAKQTWVLIAVMAILLWLALQFVGLGAAIGLLILLFISISGLFFIAAGKSGAATAAKAAARRVLYLAAATLLAVLLWCIAFVASANYQSTAMWNVPQDVWQQYPTVAAWMQHCETMGSGVYMQQVDLPASQGAATVYLVCRNGVTNEQAGKITPNPLRLRFWVTYQAGESEPMLDVLEARIQELGMNPEDYWWYCDLRRYGSCRHAGFGLGFERMVMYLTGISNIRDVELHPRTVGNAEF